MRKNFITATLIGCGLMLWVLTGLLGDGSGPTGDPPPIAETYEELGSGRSEASEPRQVRARVIEASSHVRSLRLRGRTRSKRVVPVRTQTEGLVVERPVERGDRVEAGDLLCELAVDDREAALEEARAAVREAELEYQGAQRLGREGLQSETATARAAVSLATAQARLKRAELELERTRLTAPFPGVVERLHLNAGDYARVADACVTLIEMDPLLIAADVTQNDIDRIEAGDEALAITADGHRVQGRVSFVGVESDDGTRTYPVEVTFANSDYAVRAGMTVDLRIGIETVQAHRVPPSLFSLDDEGGIGLRIIDNDNIVRFRQITVLEDAGDSTWVSGLPATTRIITVGQEFVAEGDRVEPIYDASPTVPLAAS